MLQSILTLAIFVILVIPMGKYMYHIATKQKTFADKVFNPIDRCIYKVCNPVIQEMGIDQSQGSMEGKEVRFGVPQSALFTTVTTSFSCILCHDCR